MKRWIIALLLTLLLGTSVWGLHGQYSERQVLMQRISLLQGALRQRESLKARLDKYRGMVEEAETIRAAARELGLVPENWAINRLDLDTNKDLSATLRNDSVLQNLQQALVTADREYQNAMSSLSPRSARQNDAQTIREIEIRHRAELKRIRQGISDRTRDLEREARYTPERIQELIRFLSNPAGSFSLSGTNANKACFLPQSFSVAHLYENNYAVQARGTFFIPVR